MDLWGISNLVFKVLRSLGVFIEAYTLLYFYWSFPSSVFYCFLFGFICSQTIVLSFRAIFLPAFIFVFFKTFFFSPITFYDVCREFIAMLKPLTAHIYILLLIKRFLLISSVFSIVGSSRAAHRVWAGVPLILRLPPNFLF